MARVRLCRYGRSMRHDRDPLKAFLWGEVLLFALLGAALALFLAYPTLRHPYRLPELKLVLATVFALAGGLVALLTATRFAVEGRRFDLFLCVRLLRHLGVVARVLDRARRRQRARPGAPSSGRRSSAACSAGRSIAVAPFVGGRIQRRVRAHQRARRRERLSDRPRVGLAHARLALPAGLGAVDPAVPASLTGALAVADPSVVARRDRLRESLPRAPAGPRPLARARLDADAVRVAPLRASRPLVHAATSRRATSLRLLAYGVLLVGVWRAIRAPSSGAPSPRSGPGSRATSTTGSRSTCSRSRRTRRCSRPAPTSRPPCRS